MLLKSVFRHPLVSMEDWFQEDPAYQNLNANVSSAEWCHTICKYPVHLKYPLDHPECLAWYKYELNCYNPFVLNKSAGVWRTQYTDDQLYNCFLDARTGAKQGR